MNPDAPPETSARLAFRLSVEAKLLIEQAAAASGQTVSAYAVPTLVRSAEEVLERRKLSDRIATGFSSWSTEMTNRARRSNGQHATTSDTWLDEANTVPASTRDALSKRQRTRRRNPICDGFECGRGLIRSRSRFLHSPILVANLWQTFVEIDTF